MEETQKMQAFQKAAHDAKDAYLDELTDVAWLALRHAGLMIDQRGREWDRLREAIQYATR